jgi:hypothetical protein
MGKIKQGSTEETKENVQTVKKDKKEQRKTTSKDNKGAYRNTKRADKIYPTITHSVHVSGCKGLGLGCDTM